MKRKAYMRNRGFTSHNPIVQKEKIIDKIIKETKKRSKIMVDITEAKFKEYKKVQESGMFNMFDPQAREMTTLTKDEWVTIMREYKKLNEAWGENNDKE